jgi:hypothetical protein
MPAIVILEAPMGEGKTEAALYLADRWGMDPGPRGCYVALRTQATSNQMFRRLRDFLATRYPEELVNAQLSEPSVPTIVLLPDERGAVELQRKPDLAATRYLLGRSVTITDSRVVYRLLDEAPPAAWRQSALLRQYRLVELDAHGRKAYGDYTIDLDPSLGVRILGRDEEDK